MDLLSGLFAAKLANRNYTIAKKLQREKALNGDRPHFCLIKDRTLFLTITFTYLRKLLDFFFNTEYTIVASTFDPFFTLCSYDVFLLYIYIFVTWHGLYNAFFSAFHSKKNKCNDLYLLTHI